MEHRYRMVPYTNDDDQLTDIPSRQMFPYDVFLDNLNIQFEFWNGSEKIKGMIGEDTLNRVKELRALYQMTCNSTLIDAYYDDHTRKIPYSLSRNIREQIVDVNGVAYTGHDVTDTDTRSVVQYCESMRQGMQPVPSGRPHVVVTVGLMGVGKTHVLSILPRILPREYFSSPYFTCDPDVLYNIYKPKGEIYRTGDVKKQKRRFTDYLNHENWGFALQNRCNIIVSGTGSNAQNICGRNIARALKRNYKCCFLVITAKASQVKEQIEARNRTDTRTVEMKDVRDLVPDLLNRVEEYTEFAKKNADDVEIVYVRNDLKQDDPRWSEIPTEIPMEGSVYEYLERTKWLDDVTLCDPTTVVKDLNEFSELTRNE